MGLINCMLALFLIFLKNFHIVFHTDCTILDSYFKCSRVLTANSKFALFQMHKALRENIQENFHTWDNVFFDGISKV